MPPIPVRRYICEGTAAAGATGSLKTLVLGAAFMVFTPMSASVLVLKTLLSTIVACRRRLLVHSGALLRRRILDH